MSDEETKSERRLAAVMVMDIAGYSSLMESDEAATFFALDTGPRTHFTCLSSRDRDCEPTISRIENDVFGD